MADAMVIGLELQNYNVVMSGLRQVSSAVATINGSMSKAKSAGVLIQNATINALTITGGNITINQRGGASNPRSPRSPKAPMDFMGKLKSLVMSSRFGSNGLMPLVSKAVDLLGFEAVAGVAVLKLLWSAATEAAESLTKFKDQMVTSGGSGQEVANLKIYGDVAGVGDMAALSRELADRLATNGAAAGFGHEAGIADNNGAWSSIDKAKNLQKALDFILNPNTSDMAAARFARVEGLEAFVKMRALSQATKDDLSAAARMNAMVHDESATKNAMEFNAQVSILGTNLDTLGTQLGNELLPQFTGLLTAINSFIGGILQIYKVLKPFIDFAQQFSPGNMLKKLIDFYKAMSPDGAEKASRDAHTEAMNNHSAALKNGTFGGGDRARGAMPSAWGRQNAGNWGGAGGATLLGAFNL